MAPLPRNVQRFKELFLKAGVCDDLQMRSALAKWEQWGGRLAAIIVQQGFAEEDAVMKVMTEGLHQPITHLGNAQKDPGLVAKFDAHECEQNGIFPISLRNRVLQVAMADPTDIRLIDELQAVHGARVQALLASESEIRDAINRIFRGVNSDSRSQVPGGSSGGIGVSSTAQRNEPVFEFDTDEPPAPGDDAAPPPPRAVRNLNAPAPAGAMARPPSANTMLDEMFEDGAAPAPATGFTPEDLQRLEAARVNQHKTATILRVVRELLTEKGLTR